MEQLDSYQLPMSMANIPAQGDPRIALNVKPPVNVDPLGETSRAYGLAEQEQKYQHEQESRADQQLLQQALQSGADMQTPDGIKKLADSLKGKVHPDTYANLLNMSQKSAESAAKTQENLMHLDEQKFGLVQKQTDFVLKGLSSLAQEYESDATSKGVPVAVDEFEKKKQATLKAMSESKVVPDNVIQELSKLTPTQLKAKLEQTSFYQDMLTKASQRREQEAKAKKEEAMAQMYQSGGKEVAMLEAVRQAHGEDSPEYKAALQRLSGVRAATSVEPTMTPDAIDMAAERLLKGDKSALQNLGRGAQGAANITAVNNRLASMAKERGFGADDILRAQVTLRGAGAGMVSVGQRQARLDTAIAEVDQFADNALTALDKVSRGDVVPVNAIMRRVKTGTGSPDEVEFATYVQSLANAYASVIARGAPTTVESLQEAEKIISKDFSKPQFKAMITALKKESAAAMKSSETAGDNIRRGIGKTGKEGGGDPAIGGNATHPVVDPATQKERDADGAAILQGEVKKAEARVAQAKTPEDKARAESDLQAVQRELAKLGVKPAATQSPAASKPAPAKKVDVSKLPPKNAKGWELHVDAKGNAAYVSPDGKQYEEVK